MVRPRDALLGPPAEALRSAVGLGVLDPGRAVGAGVAVAGRTGLNQAWLVESLPGAGVVVKVGRDEHAEPRLVNEQRRLAALRDVDGLADRVPEPLGATAPGGFAVRLMPGRPLGVGGLAQAQARSLGRALALVHSERAPEADMDGCRPLALTLHRPTVRDVNSAPPGLRAVIEIVQAAERLAVGLEAAAERWLPEALIHGDIMGENLLVDGGRVHIIDWESAGRGDPAWDLGSALALTVTGRIAHMVVGGTSSRTEDRDDAAARATLESYLAARSLSDAERTRLVRAAETMVAVRLVQNAAELAAQRERPPASAIVSLQVADHLFARPHLVGRLLGLEETG
jgi:Ser/Thr protein kinase RdoA (MazF antagonist)